MNRIFLVGHCIIKADIEPLTERVFTTIKEYNIGVDRAMDAFEDGYNEVLFEGGRFFEYADYGSATIHREFRFKNKAEEEAVVKAIKG